MPFHYSLWLFYKYKYYSAKFQENTILQLEFPFSRKVRTPTTKLPFKVKETITDIFDENEFFYIIRILKKFPI